MAELRHTMQEWMQVVENEIQAGHVEKALEIQSKLNESADKKKLCRAIYKKAWLSFKEERFLIAESLFLWLQEIRPKSFKVNLSSAAVNQKKYGRSIASEKFRDFVERNPVYHYRKSSSENSTKIGIFLAAGKRDLNFRSGGFTLPEGQTESFHLVRKNSYAASMLFCEGVSSTQIDQFDILLNAVSDADIHLEFLNKQISLLSDKKIPIINHPQSILNNTREKIVENIPPSIDVIIPKTVRVNLVSEKIDDLTSQISMNKLGYPVLIRPIGSQTGENLVLLNTEEEACEYHHKDGWFYLTEFHDFRSVDGYYRKYRVWNIGGKTVPNHLFLSDKWNVHGTSRFETMIKNQWMIDEEKSFINGDSKSNQDGFLCLISTLQNVTGLDYFGVDFGFTKEGIPILFEANPTMRSNYPEWMEQFPCIKDVHRNHTHAFHALIESKINSVSWIIYLYL
ncbi:MAG: hypothetical protein AAGE59_25735 [Cyanobacteria bacterium P01_F01_bin.86]